MVSLSEEGLVLEMRHQVCNHQVVVSLLVSEETALSFESLPEVLKGFLVMDILSTIKRLFVCCLLRYSHMLGVEPSELFGDRTRFRLASHMLSFYVVESF